MKTLKLFFTSKMPLLMMLMASSFLIVSCGDDDDGGGTTPGGGGTTTEEPISSFQFAVSSTDWRVVDFSNFSQNATEYAWDFGDSNTSTEESPSHSYDVGGTYEVTLAASNGTTSKSSSKTITVSDPNEAIKSLTGDVSKSWKLYREGTSMSLGPDATNPAGWWAGLTNDGSRPCAYEQEFVFHLDGTYEFKDNGMFWAEFGVFNNVEGCDQNTNEQCLEATAANMINACGDDVSGWLSGTHSFEYDPSTATLTLNGNGAWIGIPKLGSAGETIVPESSVSTKVTFESFTGYDLMYVVFDYGGAYWPITYANYSDPSLEPAVETEAEEFGEDLTDITPAELSRTFASADAADWVLLDTIASGSLISFGVDNPDGSGSLVGQFERIATDFQELQMTTAPEKNDINFSNMTTISIDIYMPSTNDYSGSLTKNMVIGFGDTSQTEQWWTGLIQYESIGDALADDEWHTVTFDLSAPSFASNADETPFDRNDLDMVYIGFGGSGHPDAGTYFVRNFVIR